MAEGLRHTDGQETQEKVFRITNCSVQFSSVTQSCPTSCEPMDCCTSGLPVITNSWRLLKLMSIELVVPSNHPVLCRPLLFLPSVFLSIRVFSNESVLRIRWPKYCSFSFNISASNEHPGLICFRMDWLDLIAVYGTLKSLLQHHSSKASILLHPAFFTAQLSHSYRRNASQSYNEVPIYTSHNGHHQKIYKQ